MLARLLASDMLPEVWRCDKQTRVLRRRISRRTQLVRQPTRAKNRVHAVLIRERLEWPTSLSTFRPPGGNFGIDP